MFFSVLYYCTSKIILITFWNVVLLSFIQHYIFFFAKYIFLSPYFHVGEDHSKG